MVRTREFVEVETWRSRLEKVTLRSNGLEGVGLRRLDKLDDLEVKSSRRSLKRFKGMVRVELEEMVE